MEKHKELDKEWSDLHTKLVNEIISFCKKNRIKDASIFTLYADGLEGSIEKGEWLPYTDSSFRLLNKNNEEILKSI